MPYLGLGVFETADGKEVIQAIHHAFEAGYRHVDTATLYNNEKGVGEAVRTGGLRREEVFVTSKVWNTDQGYDSTLKAFDHTLKLMKLDYLDLYLIHWPVRGKFKDTWRALEHLYQQGRVRAIGVSNFLDHHLQDLFTVASTIPAINQMEFHPYLVQQHQIDFCKRHQIQYEAWSPLMRGEIGSIPLIKELASKYEKSPAQIVLRWNLQKEIVTIPKSAKKERIIENAKLFDFQLSVEEMKRIDTLDRHHRTGPDPDNF